MFKKIVTVFILITVILFSFVSCNTERESFRDYKARRISELKSFAEGIIACSDCTDKGLKNVENIISEAEHSIKKALKRSTVKEVFNSARYDIFIKSDKYWNFNARWSFYRRCDISGRRDLTPEFLEQNRTYNAPYLNPNVDSTSLDRILYDKVSPESFAYVFYNEEQLSKAMVTPPVIDYNKRIVVLFTLTTQTCVTYSFVRVRQDDDVIKINLACFIDERQKPDDYTPMYMQSFGLVLLDKMDITDVSKAELCIYKFY